MMRSFRQRLGRKQRQGKTALSLMTGLALAGIAAAGLGADAGAQTRAEPLSLVVPGSFTLAPGADTALPVQIAPAAAIPRRAIVLIRGLPPTIALSEGRLFESGVWGVPAADLGRVKISAASGGGGRNELSISVVTIDGALLAEARSSVVFGQSSGGTIAKTDPSDKTQDTAAPPQDIAREPSGAARYLSAEDTKRLLLLVKKGDEQMQVGNLSAARLLYRHAAESGLAAAALALAASYDEAELGKLRVRGAVQADQKQAQLWYEKAGELGSAEASERLLRLGAR